MLVNRLVGFEQPVDWICHCLNNLRDEGQTRIVATVDAGVRRVAQVNATAGRTLFALADSWFLGANVPGKPRVFMPCVAKMGVYRQECDEAAR